MEAALKVQVAMEKNYSKVNNLYTSDILGKLIVYGERPVLSSVQNEPFYTLVGSYLTFEVYQALQHLLSFSEFNLRTHVLRKLVACA